MMKPFAIRLSTLGLAALMLIPGAQAQPAGTWTWGSVRAVSATTQSGGGSSRETRELSAVPADASAGALGFILTNGGFVLINGNVNINASRINGSTGAVSVTCATQDGTAVAGVDYTATSTTLSWADGDSTDKTFTVPIINRNLPGGTTLSFNILLSNPTGGAVLGATPAVVYTIRYNAVVPQPTVEITSPPADVTLVSGTPISLSASVVDPGGILSLVQFYLNGSLYATSTGKGPFTLQATVPAPGSYELKAVVTDNQNRQSVSTRTVTAIAPDPTDPVPAASLYTDIGGRQLAGGSTVVLTAKAESLRTDGTPLSNVSFFADNTLIASYDGMGNLLSGASGSVAPDENRHLAAASAGSSSTASTGTVFTAAWSIPNLSKLVNLLTVATTASGRSQVSTAATVQTLATTAGSNQPPSAVISALPGGKRVRTGVAITVPVAVSDPNAGTTNAIGGDGAGRRLSTVGVPGSLISSVEFYLNQVKVGTSTQPPYSLAFTPPSDGTYVLEAIATDDLRLSGVATPVIVEAVSNVSAVSISVAGGGNATSVQGGTKIKLFVTRSGTDLSQPLTVTYNSKGSAVSGSDYKPLAGTVTIPAGAASAKITVRTLNAGVSAGGKLQIKLTPDANGLYDLGTPAAAKIRIVNLD